MKQMKGGKLFWLVLSLVLIASLVLVAVAYAADPDKQGKPDKQKPVPATNVELVKKVTVKMHGPSIVPPGQKGNKKVNGAATGILGAEVSGSKYAIVVGISDYPGEINDLNYCDDDANEMYDVLTDVYGFSEVTLLLDLDATCETIMAAIDDIQGTADADDEVVFLFSGHGGKGIAEDGDNERWDEAICAHDGDEIVPIWDGELKEAFSDCTAARIIFVFDTCLAGGMKKDLEADGRVIAMAITEGGSAYEFDDLENGEFSYFFVDQGMREGYANTHDYDEDDETGEPEQVTVEEAFDYANANCQRDKPTIGDYFENDLLL